MAPRRRHQRRRAHIQTTLRPQTCTRALRPPRPGNRPGHRQNRGPLPHIKKPDRQLPTRLRHRRIHRGRTPMGDHRRRQNTRPHPAIRMESRFAWKLDRGFAHISTERSRLTAPSIGPSSAPSSAPSCGPVAGPDRSTRSHQGRFLEPYQYNLSNAHNQRAESAKKGV